jgi:putative flippase GtrA
VRFLPRVLRFGIIGATSTGSYIILALAGEALGLPVALASVIAYAITIPLSYFGHRHLTFESDRPHREAASRFVALNLFGIGLSIGAPWLLCDRLELPAAIGVFTVAVLVPLASFVGQSLFVFPGEKQPRCA